MHLRIGRVAQDVCAELLGRHILGRALELLARLRGRTTRVARRGRLETGRGGRELKIGQPSNAIVADLGAEGGTIR